MARRMAKAHYNGHPTFRDWNSWTGTTEGFVAVKFMEREP